MKKPILSLVLYYVIMFWGNPTENFQFTELPTLKISFQKASLSLAALKDTQEFVADSIDVSANVVYESLDLVSPVTEPKNEIEFLPGPRLVNFSDGMTLSKSDIIFVAESSQKVDSAENKMKLQKLVANLNSSQANRLLGAEDLDSVLSEDWEAANVEEVAKRLVWQDIERESLPKKEKVEEPEEAWNSLASNLDEQKQYVYIQPKPRPQEAPSSKQTGGNGQRLASNDRTPPPNDNPVDIPSIYTKSKTTQDTEPSTAQPYNLKGSFSFVQGVGFLFGQHKLEIYHYSDTYVKSRAQIGWSDASFDIFIDELKGSLVADVIDQDGFVIGSTSLDLNAIPKGDYHLKGFYLPIEPNYNGMYIQTISAYSFDSYIKEEGHVFFNYPGVTKVHQSDGSGLYENKYIANNSTANYQFKGKGSWTTTKYVEAGNKEYVPVFEDSMVEALLSILKDQGMNVDTYSNGIVWGKIKTNEKGGAGAQVEVSDASAYGPSYLDNYYLPGKGYVTTTKNGYFIFVGVKPGIHSLNITYAGKRLAKPIEVMKGNISYIEIDLTEKVRQDLLISEMDTDIGGEIESYIVGNSDISVVQTNPFQVLSVRSSTANLFEFRRKNAWFTYRSHLAQSSKQIHLRMLEESKLRTYQEKYQWKNMLIGFVNPKDFSAIFIDQTSVEKDIHYFDFAGDLIAKEDLSLRWNQVAGYILTKLSSGPHQLDIFDQQGNYQTHYVLMGDDLVYLVP